MELARTSQLAWPCAPHPLFPQTSLHGCAMRCSESERARSCTSAPCHACTGWSARRPVSSNAMAAHQAAARSTRAPCWASAITLVAVADNIYWLPSGRSPSRMRTRRPLECGVHRIVQLLAWTQLSHLLDGLSVCRESCSRCCQARHLSLVFHHS